MQRSFPTILCNYKENQIRWTSGVIVQKLQPFFTFFKDEDGSKPSLCPNLVTPSSGNLYCGNNLKCQLAYPCVTENVRKLGTTTEKVSKLCRTGSQLLTAQSQKMKTTGKEF